MEDKWLGRAVGLVLASVAGGAAALLWFAIASGKPPEGEVPGEGLILGVWNVFYDIQAPSPRVFLAAVALALLSAAGIAMLERRVANKSRRSSNRLINPLAPKIVMAATRGVFAGPVTVTALIPAYNEEASLGATLSSLLAQSHRPERVIVVADNFTNDRALMAVGGLFYGEEGFGLLGQFQRNEYIRYSRQISRRRGHVFVLTGTASMFRPAALRAVAKSRGAT